MPEALRVDAGIDPYNVGADSISARGLAAAAGWQGRATFPPKGKALGALLLLRPAVAAPHRLIPALQPSGALVVGDARHKLTVHRPVLQHVLGAAPIADGQPGQIRRAQRRRFHAAGALDRQVADVRHRLQ